MFHVYKLLISTLILYINKCSLYKIVIRYHICIFYHMYFSWSSCNGLFFKNNFFKLLVFILFIYFFNKNNLNKISLTEPLQTETSKSRVRYNNRIMSNNHIKQKNRNLFTYSLNIYFPNIKIIFKSPGKGESIYFLFLCYNV